MDEGIRYGKHDLNVADGLAHGKELRTPCQRLSIAKLPKIKTQVYRFKQYAHFSDPPKEQIGSAPCVASVEPITPLEQLVK